MILITGATGKLGSLVVTALLEKGVPVEDIAVLARSAERAASLGAAGVEVRTGDYLDQTSLESAFQGIDKLLFISSSDVIDRRPAHENVVRAAKTAGVKLVVYTSILNVETSKISLARDHAHTERSLKASGLPHVLLRNGWYFENYTENLGSVVAHGVVLGAAGDGKFSMAARKDFAEAAATVLTHRESQAGKVYELGGTEGITLADLAAEVGKQTEKPVTYVDLSQSEYQAKLEGFGLPAPVATLLADADNGAKNGELGTSSRDLESLIGRPTTSLAQAVREGLANLQHIS